LKPYTFNSIFWANQHIYFQLNEFSFFLVDFSKDISLFFPSVVIVIRVCFQMKDFVSKVVNFTSAKSNNFRRNLYFLLHLFNFIRMFLVLIGFCFPKYLSPIFFIYSLSQKDYAVFYIFLCLEFLSYSI
jgi:hypothetical protein